ncbi:hypothetical protein BCR34DRAFT_570424 [Clohesyomyces aquaticus]|uniref:Uncharacterized protein n=1 Tax=Clohesyomyces aquaticus TaxID=1231657 RepID=A0A1Y1ZCU8_9PLEO|nr:hypothetical protein BCR34DRAFT_570424 [Clohesyomyces aquaticus]
MYAAIKADEANGLPPRTFESSKRTKWKRGLWQTCVGLSLLVLAFLVIFGLFMLALNGDYPDCNTGDYSTFDIDTLYFDLSLGAAKLIDVAWNMVAGRGGQAIIAISSYRVVSDSLMRITELGPVDLRLFTALSLNHGQFTNIYHTSKAIISLKGKRRTMTMIWITFSSIFLLAFPTLMDTATGYVQKQKFTYQYSDDGIIVPWYDRNQTRPGGALCVPVKDGRYQWGFSGFWSQITVLTFTAWLIGTFGIWMDAQHNCQLRRKGRTMDTFRAVEDIAGAIAEGLGPHTCGYSGKELSKALKKTAPVRYYCEEDEVTGLTRIGLTSRNVGKFKLSWTEKYG